MASALGRTQQVVPRKRHQSRMSRLSPTRQNYHTPGPGCYDAPSMNAKTVMSTKRSNPSFSFGGRLCQIDRSKTGPSAAAMQLKDNPGPSTYFAGEQAQGARGIGTQASSMKPTMPRNKFGQAVRGAEAKLYTVTDEGKGMIDAPAFTPGPGRYNTEEGCGIGNGGLFESTPPAWGFGQQERKPIMNEVG